MVGNPPREGIRVIAGGDFLETRVKEFSFPKEGRLRSNSDFINIYRRGKIFRGENFLLYILPNNLDRNRIGFSISKKKAKKSTKRNRLKRLLRESYRLNSAHLKKGLDLVMSLSRGNIESMSLKTAESEMMDLFKKADIIA